MSHGVPTGRYIARGGNLAYDIPPEVDEMAIIAEMEQLDRDIARFESYTIRNHPHSQYYMHNIPRTRSDYNDAFAQMQDAMRTPSERRRRELWYDLRYHKVRDLRASIDHWMRGSVSRDQEGYESEEYLD